MYISDNVTSKYLGIAVTYMQFGLIPFYLKILYFHPVLQQKNTKQKKSFKIVLILAYGGMRTKPNFINGLKMLSVVLLLLFHRTITKMQKYTRLRLVFLRFPKISQHPACIDHALLHGKPFSNLLFTPVI